MRTFDLSNGNIVRFQFTAFTARHIQGEKGKALLIMGTFNEAEEALKEARRFNREREECQREAFILSDKEVFDYMDGNRTPVVYFNNSGISVYIPYTFI